MTQTHFGYQQVPEEQKAHKVAEVFHSVAAKYDVMNDLMSAGLHRVWKAFTVAQAGIRPGFRVLDLAGGTGDLARAFAKKAGPTGEVWHTDINESMLRVGRDRMINDGLLLPTLICDAEKLPFPDNYFDRVSVAFGLRNMTHKEAALAEMRRVLKPGGKLVVTVPALMWLWSHNDVINAHQRRYTRAELNQKLERHGLHVLAASYNNFFLFPMAAGLILVRRGRAEPELASPHFDDDAYQVEMEPAPPGMNGVLTGVGKVEAALVKRVALPIGTSIMCIAER
jgi:ubiquinone/menaquinone biosynthesis methyltransferase